MKVVKKFLHSGQVQRSDNTNLGNQIITNLPMDESAESKFYRDLAFLSAMTEDEKESEDFYNRATNQGGYLHTVAPTDIEARTGWMEINPLTGDVIPHAATTVSAAPLTEGQRMWNSPAFQLALAPLLNMPFLLGDFTKVATPFFNLENVLATNWYKNLVARYGQKGADVIVEKISTPEFEQQFLAGRTPARARWEAEKFRRIREFTDKITDPNVKGSARLSGSAAVALEGSINRTGAVPHDLDYMVSLRPFMPIENLNVESLKLLPIIKQIELAIGRPVKVFEIPVLFLRFPNLYKALKGRHNIFLTKLSNTDDILGTTRVAQTEVEGVPIDLFFSNKFFIPESKYGTVSALHVLDWKHKLNRPKDILDIRNYNLYSDANPLVTETSGHWSPFSFGNTILEDGLPVVQDIPTFINKADVIPAVMNLEGKLMSVNNPTVLRHFPGYLIKSLMRGNPLELLLSKNGTIHRSVIESYMSKKPRVERMIVNQVLNEKFKGINKINYNDFKSAVQSYILKPKMSWYQGFYPALNSPYYSLGYGPEFTSNFKDVGSFAPRLGRSYNSIGKELRGKAGAEGMLHNRIKIRMNLIEKELENLQKQMPSLNRYMLGDDITALPKEEQELVARWKELISEHDQLDSELGKILNTTGGLYYPQIMHIQLDITTKYILEALRRSVLKKYKKAVFPNTPDYYRRLKKLGLDPQVTMENPNLSIMADDLPELATSPDGYLIVDVPLDYNLREIAFKYGGRIKKNKL